jgi:hypothetical protein
MRNEEGQEKEVDGGKETVAKQHGRNKEGKRSSPLLHCSEMRHAYRILYKDFGMKGAAIETIHETLQSLSPSRCHYALRLDVLLGVVLHSANCFTVPMMLQ